MSRFGMCTSLTNAPIVAQQGFDYIEGAASAIAAMSPEEYAAARDTLLSTPIRMEAANVFMPGTFRLTGPDADLSPIPAYLEGLLPRLQELGCEVIVFGSAGARNVPEGFPMEKATEQLVQFLRLAGDACAKVGIRIAIEPLNRGESNIVNSVSEGLHLASLAAHPQVGGLADWYHVALENEGTQGILDAGDRLWHCHIANREGRVFPKEKDGQDESYAAFFGALRSIGYKGRVSIEGKGEVESEGEQGLAVLRKYPY